MAERCVDLVREVERSGPSRQIYDFTLRSERVNPVLKQLRAHAFEEVAIVLIAGSVLRFQQLSNPLDLAFVLRVPRTAFLVRPVCRYSKLRVLVHLAGTYLHFHAFAARTYDGGVNGPIEVPLRCSDIVVKLTRNVVPQ